MEKNGIDTREWRSRLISYCLKISVIFGFIAFIPGSIIAVSAKHWFILGVNAVTYVVVIALWALPRLGDRLRAIAFIAVMMANGTILLVSLGPWGAGIAWMFAAIVLSMLFLGIPGWIFTSVTYGLDAAAMAVAVRLGVSAWPISAVDWVVHAIAVFAAASGVSIAMNYLVTNVETTLRRQAELNARLVSRQNDARRHSERQLALLQEVHHRVRNNLQLLISLSNISRPADSPRETRQESRIWCLSLAHDLTYSDGIAGDVDLFELVSQVSDHYAEQAGFIYNRYWCRVEGRDVRVPPSLVGVVALLVDEVLDGWVAHSGEGPTSPCAFAIDEREGSGVVIGFSGKSEPERVTRFLHWFRAANDDVVGALVSQLEGELDIAGDGEHVHISLSFFVVDKELRLPSRVPG